ncbi:MAG: protein kinase [Myxococcales bacterium]|nr:protein kinase [Myxococcales bacterium]
MFVCPECGAAQGGPGHCGADGAQLQHVGEDLLLGQPIGAYRVARLLGIGGMGRVYKGVHPTIGSRVAIKVLSRECSDRKDLVERFFAEAKAVNLIRHESIVNVLDLAMLPDGRPYIIMEYLDGAPLSALIEHAVQTGTPMPLGGLARLAAEVLDALGAAHAKGIVHRDLKPDNIFVTPAGRPKVLDFGIAKLTDTPVGSGTATGSLLGTPHYMAPEQAAGRPVDHRADLYAMGVILFECATGQKPFTADSLFDLLRKHVEAPPPHPRMLRHDIPAELEQLILVALAKAPEQRFGSAQAMSMALQHATAGLPAEAWAPVMTHGRPGGNPTPSWPSQAASWAGSGSRSPAPPAPSGQRPLAPSGQRPLAPSGERPLGHQTTVSAGQVTKASGGGSKKGVWIAVVALLLIGGGIAAAVVAGGGGGTGESTTASAGDPSGSASEGSAPASPATASTSGTTAPAGGSAATASAGGPAPAGGGPATTAPSGGSATKAAGGPTTATVPAPTGGAGSGSAAARVSPTAEADDEDDVEVTPGGVIAAAVEEDDDTEPQPAGGWFKRHAVSSPSKDYKKFDVDKHIAWAIAEAKRTVPDAQLFRIDMENVYPSGFADLTLPGFAYKYGGIDLRFISPSHNKRDPKIPRGVSVEIKCSFRIDGGPEGFEIRDLGGDCDEVIMPPPKCTLSQVWKKALAKHPDMADAVASIDYRAQGKRPTWWFTIYGDDHRSLVSETYPDDCGAKN